MQAVVFHVGSERFAIGTDQVTEVVPGIAPRPVPAAHEALLGVIDYRGVVVPVLDLCRLFGRGACPVRLSNRIIVCDLEHTGRRWGASDRGAAYLGVLAEDVTRVRTIDPDAAGSHPGPETEGFSGLGTILRDDQGLLQFVDVTQLVPGDVLDALRLRAAEESS